MNARLLRALVGANDQLRASYLATDDDEVRRRINAVTREVNSLLGFVVKGPPAPGEDEDPDLSRVIS